MSKKRNKKRPPKRTLALPDLEQSKAAVLNTLTSKSGQRSYDRAITDFVEWYGSEPRLAFNRTVVLRYRIYLEQKQYAAHDNQPSVGLSSSPRLRSGRFRSPQLGTSRRNSTSKGGAPDWSPHGKLAHRRAEQATLSGRRQGVATRQEELRHARDADRMRTATRRVARVAR